METKKRNEARKKINNAVSTFSKAVAEAEKANDLLTQSRKEDVLLIEKYEQQITDLYTSIDHIQASVIEKEREMSNNDKLISRLKEFTV